jgi:hypothetical protein
MKFKLFITVALVAIFGLAFMPADGYALTGFVVEILWQGGPKDTNIISWFVRNDGNDFEMEWVSSSGDQSWWQVWVEDEEINEEELWFILEPNDVGLDWDGIFPDNQGLPNVGQINDDGVITEEAP